MTVYLEAVIGLNFLIDLVLLALVGLSLGLPLRAGRVAAGALIGGVYAAVHLGGALPPVSGTAGKLAVALLMVLVAYPSRGLAPAARAFGVFCLASVAAGGFALALAAGGGLAAAAGGAIVLGRGARSVLPYALAGSAGLVYLAGGALAKAAGWRRQCLDSIIVVGPREARVSALLDTGNELRDPITRQPVLVVEFAAISDLLPPQVREGYALGRPEVVAAAVGPGAPGEGWAGRVRLLPFRALGTSRGLLLGFRPDAVVVEGPRHARRRIDGLIVAVSPVPLGGGSGYQALLPPSAVAWAPGIGATSGAGGERA
ncbi:MAG: sigma-E processing peptidase SpoIIGA [Bacillota bacterium]|nr:sigma-E processing peptidase SpoIIGA [Bacillota bacterium]